MNVFLNPIVKLLIVHFNGVDFGRFFCFLFCGGGGVGGIARYLGFCFVFLQDSSFWLGGVRVRVARGRRFCHSTTQVSGGLVRVPVCSAEAFLTCDLVSKESQLIPRSLFARLDHKSDLPFVPADWGKESRPPLRRQEERGVRGGVCVGPAGRPAEGGFRSRRELADPSGTGDRTSAVVGSANSSPDTAMVNILSQIIEFVAGNCVWKLYGRVKGCLRDAGGFGSQRSPGRSVAGVIAAWKRRNAPQKRVP